jgi:RNA polymerase sigma-B factor
METSPPRKWDTWRTPEELIADGLPIARFVARRFAGRGEAEEDLVQVAMIGLVKAARRFDPTLGNQFVSYATATIVGELKRHFRDHRWGMHVGRSAQERYLLVRQAAEWATTATGRAPTVDEIAKQAGLSVEDVIEAQHLATAMHLDSLESPAPSSTARIGNERSVGVVDARFDRVNDRMCLQRILPGLAKREREILWLRFVEERSLESRDVV